MVSLHYFIPLITKTHSYVLFLIAAYIYIRGEFYNEASNMQVAINEVQFITPKLLHYSRSQIPNRIVKNVKN